MAEEKKLVEGKYLRYLDRPLVRDGNTIVYGDMSEKCILILEIMSYKNVSGQDVPDSVFIQVVESKNQSKIIRQGQKNGLSTAFSLGMIWLEMANK